jgi:predicted nucleotidyltransferase
VRTTVALDPAIRDRLLALKREWGLPSVEAVLRRLLEGAPQSARALYESRRDEVDAVLRQHKVRRVVAFGSRARGDARPESDLDLAVQMPRDADLFDLVHLRDDLAAAFGMKVDVVTLSSAPPRLRQRIRKEGIALVG